MAQPAVVKRYLLTAGPTPVPERVLLAMAQPIIFHRCPEFSALLEQNVRDLQWVCQTRQPVLVLGCSGSGAMEAAVVNALSPGDKALCVLGGRFGERWRNICRAFGLSPIEVEVPWGQPIDPGAVKRILDQHPDVKAVFCTASESSTGVAHPIREIAALCQGRDTLCVVDAISAIGGFDVPQDAWGIDVLVGAGQKALMIPPGLSFVSLSERAWARAEKASLPRFYFDFRKLRKSQEKSETTWTPPVTLMSGLKESFAMLREEGLHNVFARHLKLAEATRQACAAIGCELFATQAPSPTLTAVRVPGGVDGSAVVKAMRQKLGITISGGQEHLKGKIFRIAHMGYYGPFDMVIAISALEMALAEHGHTFTMGAGVAAAQRVFLQS
jgi:aspartate aminotransferase-like enzyme